MDELEGYEPQDYGTTEQTDRSNSPDLMGEQGPQEDRRQAPADYQRDFTPPTLPEPFNAADDIELANLQAALATTRRQSWDGELHPLEAKEISQEIMREAAPLAQRKKAAESQMEAETAHKAMKATATATMIQGQNQKYIAENFGSGLGQFMDPNTGKLRTFVPEGWTETEDRETEPYPNLFPTALQSDEEDAGGEGAAAMKGGGVIPEGAGRAEGDTVQGMTIYNSQDRQVMSQGGKLLEHTDNQGRPVQGQQPQQEMFGLNKQTLDFVRNVATVGAMHLPPGRSRDAMYSHLYQRGLVQAMQEQAAEKRNKVQMEHENRVATQKELTTEAASLEKERVTMRGTIGRDVQKEYLDAKKIGEVPAELATAEGRAKEVNKRMEELWGYSHEGVPHSGPITAAGLKKLREEPAETKGGQENKSGQDQTPQRSPSEALPIKEKADLPILAGKVGVTPVQLEQLVGREATIVSKDKSTIEGVIVDPKTGNQFGAPGKYMDLPPSVQKLVAEQRVQDQLQRRLPPPPAAQAGPPAAAGPAQAAQPANVVQQVNDLKAKYGITPASEGERAKAAEEGSSTSWWRRLLNPKNYLPPKGGAGRL